jgi:hypothetical protein
VKKIGFLVRDLAFSQSAYHLIRNANAFLEERGHEVATYVFYERLARPCLVPRFFCSNLHDAWAFDGPLVATTLATAEKLRSFPSSPRKLFYAWDLEWMRAPAKGFPFHQDVYGDPRLELVARGPSHARAIEDAWNRAPVAVIPDMNIPTLWNLAIGGAPQEPR